METFRECMHEYKRQMQKGVIRRAYSGLMEYILGLRTHFSTRYPEHAVSGSVYAGYMDMTYFAIAPRSLKDRGLKVAVVFIHESCRFEAWLAASNRPLQARYWRHLSQANWATYRLVPPATGVDSILEHVLASDPDWADLDALTSQIERETMRLVQDVVQYLAQAGDPH